jgi:predicted transglutaminase-like cysteine proteinase
MSTRAVVCLIAAISLAAAGRLQGISLAFADVDAAAIKASTAIAGNAATVAQQQASSGLSASPRPALLDLAPILIEPFSSATLPWFSGDVFDRWRSVKDQIRAESDILAHCRETKADCSPAAQKFLAIIVAGRAQTGRARVGTINRAVNMAIQPMSDLKQWGVAEHWSAPLETFTTGHGDCEDYAIAKFVALIAAGVAPEDVKLVIVRDKVSADGHAVAAARVDGHWLVLDNRWLTLAEDRDMVRMAPLFVIDHTGVRTYVRGLLGAVASAY